MHVIDTHAHLDMSEFDSDRVAVIERAGQAGVKTIVTIGIDAGSSQAAVDLAQKYSSIYATVGMHPHDAKRVTAENMAHLEALARQPRVVAMGEMGLDYYRNTSPKDAQVRVFRWQLDLADKVGLPVIIHCRQAVPDMLEILRQWSSKSQIVGPKGIIHCFSGDLATVKTYIEMGFYIALGGYISYPSSVSFKAVIRDIPLEKIVLETDCPFLPPQQYRGMRNEPAYTILTLQVLADIKRASLEEIADCTTANAKTVLRIPT